MDRLRNGKLPRRRRIEESVVRKSVEKQALEEQVKREQDIAHQKEYLEELRL